jgi:hypothetical protein
MFSLPSLTRDIDDWDGTNMESLQAEFASKYGIDFNDIDFDSDDEDDDDTGGGDGGEKGK